MYQFSLDLDAGLWINTIYFFLIFSLQKLLLFLTYIFHLLNVAAEFSSKSVEVS